MEKTMAVGNSHALYQLIRNTRPRRPGLTKMFKESDDTDSLWRPSAGVLDRKLRATTWAVYRHGGSPNCICEWNNRHSYQSPIRNGGHQRDRFPWKTWGNWIRAAISVISQSRSRSVNIGVIKTSVKSPDIWMDTWRLVWIGDCVYLKERGKFLMWI